ADNGRGVGVVDFVVGDGDFDTARPTLTACECLNQCLVFDDVGDGTAAYLIRLQPKNLLGGTVDKQNTLRLIGHNHCVRGTGQNSRQTAAASFCRGVQAGIFH